MSPTSPIQWQEYLDRLEHAPDRTATEQELEVADERLGARLPESLRNLLARANGWEHDDSLHGLCSTTQLRWTNDPGYDLVDVWSSFEEIIEMIGKCLVVLDDGNGRLCLIDASRTNEDGEWLAYDWRAGDGEDPLPYPSLSALIDQVTSRSAADGLPRTRPATASR